MKKLMLGMFILLFVVAVSCVGGVKKAEADPMVTGDIGFSIDESTMLTIGDVVTNNPLTAAKIDFASPAPNAEVNLSGLGSFAPFGLGHDTTFFDFAFASVPVSPLWSMDDGTTFVSFDLNTIVIDPLTSTTRLSLNGVGTIKMTGHDDTVGTWSLSADTSIAGGRFSFSSTTAAAVPEPGTVALLGIGLAGLVGVGARRRAKKKAA